MVRAEPAAKAALRASAVRERATLFLRVSFVFLVFGHITAEKQCAVCDDIYKTCRFAICSANFVSFWLTNTVGFMKRRDLRICRKIIRKNFQKTCQKSLTKREICAIILKLSEKEFSKTAAVCLTNAMRC